MSPPESTEQPTPQASPKKTKASAAGGRKPAGPKKQARVVLSEAEIDAPNRNTLIMLGVVSIMTLVLWAAGRAACNYHVPGESLTPRFVSLDEKTRSPKDVAIEFAQAIEGADFATAQALASDAGLQTIEDVKKECGACPERVKARPEIFSSAIVHRANSVDAIVEVESYRGKTLAATKYLGIERQDRKWRVTRSYASLEAAELKAPPFSMASGHLPEPSEAATTAAAETAAAVATVSTAVDQPNAAPKLVTTASGIVASPPPSGDAKQGPASDAVVQED